MDKIIAHIILEINHEKIRLILIRKTPKMGGGVNWVFEIFFQAQQF